MPKAPYGKTSNAITQQFIISYCHPQVNKEGGGLFLKCGIILTRSKTIIPGIRKERVSGSAWLASVMYKHLIL
jgi:hypothetical protein